MAGPHNLNQIDLTQLGPDMRGNLHQHRPFFLVPLESGVTAAGDTNGSRRPFAQRRAAAGAAHNAAVDRISAWLNSPQNPANGAAVTDLYILSHGWHRNYFSAVASYDRLLSMLRRLVARGVVVPPAAPPNYNPLFVGLHWSSEIGVDGWVDLTGRRHRPSFIQNCQTLFDDGFNPGNPQWFGFETFVDRAFELFAAVSAPDVDAVDPDLAANSSALWGLLGNLRLRDDLSATDADKTDALWRCYHEAIAKGVHTEQREQPRAFAGPGLKFELFVKFMLAAIPIATLIALVRPAFRVLTGWIRGPFHSLRHLFDSATHLSGTWGSVAFDVACVVGLGVVSALVLCVLAALGRSRRRQGRNYGFGWFAVLPWLLLQLVCVAPILIFIVVGYFVLGSVVKPLGLFAERKTGASAKDPGGVYFTLARLAVWPCRLLDGATEPDFWLKSAADAIESQVAFYKMQNRGTAAGEEAGEAISRLVAANPLLRDARIHLAGHSFGGLVVSNFARRWAELRATGGVEFASGRLHSVVTIEGALASGWWEPETATVQAVDRTIGSIYSAHDSACGFYYPFANAGRLATGSVGLSTVPVAGSALVPMVAPAAASPTIFVPPTAPAYCTTACTAAHIHRPLPFASLANPPALPGATGAFAAFNLDASRMIYEGAVPSGGGHTDIYKDDVLCLLWAALSR